MAASMEELVEIGMRLEKLLSSSPLDDSRALDLVKLLQGKMIHLEDLEKSRVGMLVNKLRRQTENKDVAAQAKTLIKSWKKKLKQTEVGKNSVTKAKPKSGNGNGVTPEGKKSPVSQAASQSADGDSSQETSPPQPATYSPAELPSSSGGGDSLSEDMSRRLAALPDLPLPGDDLREKSCSILINAIRKNSPSTPELLAQRLARALEQCIYSELARLDMKYKTRIRSRVLNLQDQKNPQLCANFVSGLISPEQLSKMTAEDMASEKVKQLRQLYTKDGIRDAQMATNAGTTTDLLKCGRCRKRNCTYNQLQTRSSDEPMTTFVFCNECGHRWKFC